LRWLSSADNYSFNAVVLTKDAESQMIEFARRSHPKEFSALLGGRLKDRTLTITHIIYQHFEATERSALIHLNVPTTTEVKGTCHSHPTPDNRPSAADRRYFNKYSYVNFIIGYPYNRSSIACYDLYGRPLPFRQQH
jgi:proteasome lid subunit RPN8/RPN11